MLELNTFQSLLKWHSIPQFPYETITFQITNLVVWDNQQSYKNLCAHRSFIISVPRSSFVCALMMDSQNLIPNGRVWGSLSPSRSRSFVRARMMAFIFFIFLLLQLFGFSSSPTFAAGLFWIVLQFMFLPHLLRFASPKRM